MKFTGGERQSKNVDDIRKQKPKMRVGEMGSAEPNRFNGEIELLSTESKKKMKPYKMGPNKMGDKAGRGKMIDAVERDAMDRLKRGETSLDPIKPKGLQEWTGPSKYQEPKKLNEIWTPRPVK